MSLSPGSSLGRYRIERTLGSGAMGDVYVAQDPQIERQVALKTVRLLGIGSGSMSQDDLKARLIREARTAGRLVHPNVVTLFDAGESEGLFYLAFELVNGSDLSERIRREPPLTLAEVLRIVRQTAEGLDAAHRQGIIHRDIKPSNLLLDEEGRLKISDFGIAKMLGQQTTELTQTGSVVGSPHYLSPEQVRGEELDGRSDLFSLGVVLYELLSRRRPFDGETITTLVYQILSREPVPLASVRPGLPERLERVVARLLAKDREVRFANAGELALELAALERELPPKLLASPATAAGIEGQETALIESGSAVPPPASHAPSDGVATATPVAIETGSVATSAVTAEAPHVVLTEAAPAGLGPSSLAPAPPAAGRRLGTPALVLLVLAGLGLAFVAALGAGIWWWRSSQMPPRPAVADLAAASATEPPLPVPESPGRPLEVAEEEEWREERAQEASPVPRPGEGQGPGTPAGDAAAPPAEADPPAASRPAPSPAEASPARSQAPPPEPAPAPPRAAPESAPAPPVAEAPTPSPIEPDPPERPSRQVVAERELVTGLHLSFQVTPEDTFVGFMSAGGERFTSIGQASDYPSGGRRARSFNLPGPGEYYLRFSRQGMGDRILLVRASGSDTTTVRLQMADRAAEDLRRGELERVRVAEAVAFTVQPPEARTGAVLVDGERRGSIGELSGGLRGGWLELPPGDYRISLEAPGFRRHDLLVEVRPGHPDRRQRIEVRLQR